MNIKDDLIIKKTDDEIIILPKWKYGIPQENYLIDNEVLARFISKNKLIPITEMQTIKNPKSEYDKTLNDEIELHQKFPDGSIFGGRNIVHIHYDGKVYPLNEVQWKQFSGIMLKKIQIKLSEANEISFHDLIEISSTVKKL